MTTGRRAPLLRPGGRAVRGRGDHRSGRRSSAPELAANHGVFCPGDGGRVRRFLQKPSPAEQRTKGALREREPLRPRHRRHEPRRPFGRRAHPALPRRQERVGRTFLGRGDGGSRRAVGDSISTGRSAVPWARKPRSRAIRPPSGARARPSGTGSLGGSSSGSRGSPSACRSFPTAGSSISERPASSSGAGTPSRQGRSARPNREPSSR